MHLLTAQMNTECKATCVVVHAWWRWCTHVVVVWARADVWWCLLLVVCVLGLVKEIGKYEGK